MGKTDLGFGETNLIDAVIAGKSDIALYMTCMYLHKQLHTELEDIFIQLIARVGERTSLPFVATWSHVCQELWKLIESDECHISDVFTITTMISLLYKRLSVNAASTAPTVKRQQVKKEILEYFPEKARLSYRGAEVFDPIVPKAPEELNAFVHRILAGFMRLFEQRQVHEVYQSLVYLSKRRLQLPLPSTWPAPDEEIAKQGDPIWLLWGMVLLYFRTADVATNWRLFCQHFKKKHKVQRIGLLYGLSFHLDVATNVPLWTPQEEITLRKIKEMAPSLWADFLEQQKEDDMEEVVEESPLAFFEPRGTHIQHEVHPHTYMIPSISPVKSIEVTGKGVQGKSDLRERTTRIKKVE